MLPADLILVTGKHGSFCPHHLSVNALISHIFMWFDDVFDSKSKSLMGMPLFGHFRSGHFSPL